MKEIQDLVGEVLDKEGIPGLRDLMALRRSWGSIVGEKMAANTIPYKMDKGKLFVGASSHAWVQELHYRIEDIKEQAREGLGMEIKEVIIKKVNLK